MKQLVKYTLPKLEYPLIGLDPFISSALLDLHYNKHHNTYVTNLNAATQELYEALEKQDLPKIVSLQSAIRFNGGSHINHSMYWENLSPANLLGGKFPVEGSPLMNAIKSEFGSMEQFIALFNQKATGHKGSGWAWLAYNKITKRVVYEETHDQDTVCMIPDLVPLLTVDVWEHAYYIDYKNVRAEYLKKIWNVINWKCVEERYAKATK